MTNSIYNIMVPSKTEKDSYGNFYLDAVSAPIDKFKFSEVPYYRYLNKIEIERFDLLIHYYYGTADYTDIILILNGKYHRNQFSVNDKIMLPAKTDVERFYVTYLSRG